MKIKPQTTSRGFVWDHKKIEKTKEDWRRQPLHKLADQFSSGSLAFNLENGLITEEAVDALREDLKLREEEGESSASPKPPLAIMREQTDEEKEADAKGLVTETTHEPCGGKGQTVPVTRLVRKEPESEPESESE